MAMSQTGKALEIFCTASEKKDVETMLATLAPDAELISPVSGRMVIRGHDDLRILFAAAYDCLDGIRWYQRIENDSAQVALCTAKVSGVNVNDAMFVELDEHGRIRRITHHLRPWLGLTAFAAKIGPKLGRHPGLIRRAMRS
ncbi:nuclear transport factor 2 family protein [Nocardia sp. BMG51109]|uniref:nuclear transport factor 2 family protein n=1 Tax=Nocardia sp. BMG51109 TaxID=1056816 RepID=UPI0004B1F536|nr:nuclear transport factor 2 family protein [Nocardia sp. BMG51109]